MLSQMLFLNMIIEDAYFIFMKTNKQTNGRNQSLKNEKCYINKSTKPFSSTYDSSVGSD